MASTSDDRSFGDSAARGSQRPSAQPAPGNAQRRPPSGNRGNISTRPSRESILRSYASQDEARARDARAYSQQATRSIAESAAQRDAERRARQEALAAQQRDQAAYRAARPSVRGGSTPSSSQPRERRARVVPPLSSQESYDLTRSSQASYERARASRDALSESRRGRATNREVIDGRGSIDSRTFNESQQISGYLNDDRDRPDPLMDTFSDPKGWRSRAGQGFDGVPDSSRIPRGMPQRRREPSGASRMGSTGVMSGRAQYGAGSSGPLADMPLFLKITIPIILILLIIIIVLVVA